MSAITKERIELFIKNPLDNGLTRGEQMEVAQIAMASLEAKSRKLFTCSGCGVEGLDEPLESKCHCNEDGAHWVESVVYTSPPAPLAVPVAVPDEMTPKQASRSYCGEVRGYHDGWNDCRAAMLNQEKIDG